MTILLPLAAVLVALLIKFTGFNNEFEQTVLLSLGKYHRTAGSGFYFTFPFLRSAYAKVDTRLQTQTITAEKILSRNMVPLDIDAIVFLRVTNARNAILAVGNYQEAVYGISQTTLRELAGSRDMTELLNDREACDRALKESLTEKTGKWGVEIERVEIKDILIPATLQNAMSAQEQAVRERQARVTLAGAEVQIAEQTVKAAALYANTPIALQIRQMNLLGDIARNNSTIIVPSDVSASLAGILGSAIALKEAGQPPAPRTDPR
ncbi:SPFH domain-containing protein [Acetobacter oeni]|uniref:Membrane protein n=1 Tax=Acetobacter oeni TaxID=304077 RepID=A0A511XJ65_9PROT|nr:SPFH domain-containing protein [Acetobacter oeni]MBB3882824.1 regulator of protease activity HflC (stomatin/prohibitin superfamily) [Acetobacter oeni]NHO18912.1 slipin family protein [Acetobacter oeni]GEN62990.1 membrane protein [Acetobacter oeni]